MFGDGGQVNIVTSFSSEEEEESNGIGTFSSFLLLDGFFLDVCFAFGLLLFDGFFEFLDDFSAGVFFAIFLVLRLFAVVNGLILLLFVVAELVVVLLAALHGNFLSLQFDDDDDDEDESSNSITSLG